MSKITKKISEVGAAATFSWLANRTFIRAKLSMRNFLIDYFSFFPCNGTTITDNSAKKRVFILAAVPYYDIGGGQRSAQLAKVYDVMGFEVHYFFRQHSSEKKIHRTPLPVAEHKIINRVKLTQYRGKIRPNDIVIIEAPERKFLPLIEIAKERRAKIVYENIDDWESALGGNGLFDTHALGQILRQADLITATAKTLMAQIEKYLLKFKIEDKTAILLPNAVDAALFDPTKKLAQPADLATGEKTLVYYGTLWGEWFDWEIVFGIAEKFPQFAINLIGDETLIPHQISAAPKNVHFLGLKKQAELPAYLAHSDIAILPFKINQITVSVSPVKIFEYIAMNKIVIATKLPDIVDYPNVFLGNTLESWVKLLGDISKKTVSTDAALEFTLDHTWQRCRDQILDALKN